MIKRIEKSQLPECLDVIHSSYEPIAQRFGLTAENCPYRGNADLPYDVLLQKFEAGAEMYGYFCDDKIVGFISMTMDKETTKIHDIVVLPEHQRHGIGRKLLDYAKSRATEYGSVRILLGMIDDNAILKQWYIDNKFKPVGTKKYPAAPFTTGYMEWKIQRE